MKDRVKELQDQYNANDKEMKAIPHKINKLERQIQSLRNKIVRLQIRRDQLDEINGLIEREAAAVMLLQACETRNYWVKEEHELINYAVSDAREFMEREFKRRKIEANNGDEQI